MEAPPPKKKANHSSLSPSSSASLSFDDRSLNGHVSGTKGSVGAEKEPIPTNIGSKSKACLKFFSTSGCPYGEGCHFLHYVPGGVASLGSYPSGNSTTSRKESTHSNVSIPSVPQREQGLTRSGFKTRLCKSFETTEGCRFGQKCNFAHGELDLMNNSGDRRRPLGFLSNAQFEENKGSRAYQEPSPPGLATTFGAVSIAKVVIDAALSGIIIGKGGVNAKAISRTSGAKIYIKDHESDVTLKNVEMEGSFDQIQEASRMVRELLSDKDISRLKANGGEFKSKLCENFPKGTCTFGDRCHFAHSQGELHHPPASL